MKTTYVVVRRTVPLGDVNDVPVVRGDIRAATAAAVEMLSSSKVTNKNELELSVYERTHADKPGVQRHTYTIRCDLAFVAAGRVPMYANTSQVRIVVTGYGTSVTIYVDEAETPGE